MKRWFLFVALPLLVAVAAGILFACSQAPTSVPVRTFERAQRMDVVCLRLFGNDGNPIVPEGIEQENCSPVPSDLNGGGLQNQLFALVTQTTRGEVAVVDLSAGFIVDQNRGVPGINFLPVGAIPTDIVAAPDGKMAFVASAEPNKAAIYGISTRRILGDIQGRPKDPDGPVTLSSWPVCALPQNPGALAIVPRRPSTATTTDGGVPEAGTDGGTTSVACLAGTFSVLGGKKGLNAGTAGAGGGPRGGVAPTGTNGGNIGTAETPVHFGGGSGGNGGANASTVGGNGAGGPGRLIGGAGGTNNANGGGGGGGAASVWGSGGAGGNGNAAGSSASASSYGAGGGGSGGNNAASQAGGDGAPGYVMLMYVA